MAKKRSFKEILGLTRTPREEETDDQASSNENVEKKIRFLKDPKKMGSSEYAKNLLTEIKRRQKANHKLSLEESDIRIEMPNDEPWLDIHLSDIHFGADSVDYDLMMEILDFALTHDNTFVTLYGDLAEGLKAEHLDTNVLHLLADPTQQLLGFREAFIRPLVDAGKLGAMVGQFKSHEEWLRQYSGFNPYAVLADLGPNSTVGVIKNGGFMHLVFPDGQVMVYKCHHNAGGGSSQINPVGGLRKIGADEEFDAALQGHFHSLAPAATKEVNSNGATRIYITLGGLKGNRFSDPHSTRDFGNRKGGPQGGYTVNYTDYNGERQLYPMVLMENATTFHAAATLYELAMKRGAVEDFQEQIRSGVEDKAQFQFMRTKSQLRVEDSESVTKNWKTIFYKVASQLPTTVVFSKSYRQGSSSADRGRLLDTVDFIQGDGHVVGINGRQMFDTTLPASQDREKEVWKLLNDLRPLWESEKEGGDKNIKILLWLFDGIMRSEHWKKPKKKNRLGKLTLEDADGFFAGTTISEETGIPLLDNQGTVVLSFPKASVTYKGLVLDAQAGSGSYDDPFRGLRRVEQRQPERRDFTVGGDMPPGGFAEVWNNQLGQQVFVAEGQLNREHDKGGKRNRGTPTPGPMAITFSPDRKAMFPSSSLEEAHYVHNALFLLAGLDKLGGHEGYLNSLRKSKKR